MLWCEGAAIGDYLVREMADSDKNTNSNGENMGKKPENDIKSNIPHDEDTESVEEQPLDIGEHYLVRRSDESWRKNRL